MIRKQAGGKLCVMVFIFCFKYRLTASTVLLVQYLRLAQKRAATEAKRSARFVRGVANAQDSRPSLPKVTHDEACRSGPGSKCHPERRDRTLHSIHVSFYTVYGNVALCMIIAYLNCKNQELYILYFALRECICCEYVT